MRRIGIFVEAAFLVLILSCQGNSQTGQGAPAGQEPGMSAETAFSIAAGNAERGNPGAMVSLGNFYEQGIGVSRNLIKAREWYQKAADLGSPEGWYYLGICYDLGIGNAGDAGRALECFERAAGLGLIPALEELSARYFAGTTVPQDIDRALGYLARAAEAGGESAANSLGVIYLQGLWGRASEPERAYGYFIQSANRGSLEAIKNLGVIHKDGLGVAPDPAQSLTWYLIAQKGGYQAADIREIIRELRGSLTLEAAEAAEQEAEQWLLAFKARNK
jgi:TPR repeat protein